MAACSSSAFCDIHSADGPLAGSENFSVSMLKPVENISGSTMTSVSLASGASSASKFARLAAPFCHTSGC